MVDSKYSIAIYISVKITIGTVIKHTEMLKFILDHLKTEKTCKHAVKKLPFIMRYVTDRYKTRKMCDKGILENGGTLQSVPDCYKNQQICDKAVDNYPHMTATGLETTASLAKCCAFVYELCGCGFQSHCSHLNFRYRACFEQVVP